MKRIIPGIHSVREVLKIRPGAVEELWIREGELRDDLEELFGLAQNKRIKVKRTSLRSLDQHVTSHQGIIAYANEAPSWPSHLDFKTMESGLILALDCLEDPHNVGSLMRSAWNLGAVGVITTKDRAAGLTPSAQKVASGAFEHVPMLEVVNLHAELKLLKDLGFWVYGLSADGEKSIIDVELANKSVLVVGAEDVGLRKPTCGACDVLVSIPQSPQAHSFNASVAGAIAGYEFFRQRNLSQSLKNSTK